MGEMVMPLGIDSFEEIRTDGYYYIDKTELIVQVLKKKFEVNLITRPRRFGKTLAMDMLAAYFDIRRDTKEIFKGLDIETYGDLCAEWQNRWPVLFITLKEVDDLSFEGAKRNLAVIFADLYKEHTYLLESEKVDPADKEFFQKIWYQKADDIDIRNAVYVLMRMMYAYFGRQVIVLIDEYDVPLAKANEKGFYHEMLNIISGLMGKTLKSNRFLKFAVITGCLRISKESIFTGTNNFVSDTIEGERFNEYFGFTEPEVEKLLRDTGFEDHAQEMKEWYDGYRFGATDIYCPWDVLNHVNAIQERPDTKPKNYWEDTSHNGVLRNFIELANSAERQDLSVNDKFETLLEGGYIEESIEQNLTYDTMHSSQANLWSLLYLTGYLTQARISGLSERVKPQEGKLFLRIPNEEVKAIFKKTVVEWFQTRVAVTDRSGLFDALWSGDEEKAADLISGMLFDTISYYDYQENFYHAFLAGIFAGAGFYVESNREHGEGRTDLVIRDKSKRRVMLIEAKHAQDAKGMEAACAEAVKQIDEKRYADEFYRGYRTVICYGVAFYKKDCLVKKFGEAKKGR